MLVDGGFKKRYGVYKLLIFVILREIHVISLENVHKLSSFGILSCPLISIAKLWLAHLNLANAIT